MTSINPFLEGFLLLFLLVCAGSIIFTKNLLTTVLIFMTFSTVMAVIFVILRADDLAITEIAVGAGINTVLFVVVLLRLKKLKGDTNDEDE